MNREEYLKSIEFEGSGEVYCRVVIYYPVWEKFEENLENLKEKYSEIEINVAKDEMRRKGNKIRDKWGCLWYYPLDYLDGQVIEHPLEKWEYLKDYKFPDPEKDTDWEGMKKEIREKREKGESWSLVVLNTDFYFYASLI